MTPQERKVIELALEALETERENYQDWDKEDGAPEYIYEAITAMKELLAQPEQKPVAKFHVEHRTNACSEVCDAQRKVYATCAWHKDAGQRAELICSLLNTPPPQHKEPEQEILVAVFQAITNAGLTLLKTQHGYELRKLGPAIAHNIKE